MMEEFDLSQIKGPHFRYVDKFIGKDFMFWKFKMETMLKVRDLWGLIDQKDVKLTKGEVAAIAAYTKRESQTLNLIVQNVFDS
jgi:hypothetical protein